MKITKKAESVKINAVILDNTLIEAIRSPRLRKEAQGNGLSKAVELKAAAAACIHDWRVVNNLYLNIAFFRTDPEVAMGGCAIHNTQHVFVPKYITNNQERSITHSSAVQNHFGIGLHEITVSNNDGVFKELFLLVKSYILRLPVCLFQRQEQKCSSRGKSSHTTWLPPVREA